MLICLKRDFGGDIIKKVLICDDNMEFATAISDYCKTQKDFEMLGVAFDGIQACEILALNKPDIIILDIIMPRLDGLGVLEKMRELYNDEIPTVIILSAMGQDKITQRALDLGAEYYVVKPFDIEVLFKRIRQLKVFSGKGSEAIKLKDEKSLGVLIDQDIEFQVTQIMLDLGIPAHINGYHFLRAAVILSINEPSYINNITRNLYPKVALSFETTPSRVERSIRHAIEVAWLRGNAKIFQKVLGYSADEGKPKPTNSEFIAMLSDKLRLQTKA